MNYQQKRHRGISIHILIHNIYKKTIQIDINFENKKLAVAEVKGRRRRRDEVVLLHIPELVMMSPLYSKKRGEELGTDPTLEVGEEEGDVVDVRSELSEAGFHALHACRQGLQGLVVCPLRLKCVRESAMALLRGWLAVSTRYRHSWYRIRCKINPAFCYQGAPISTMRRDVECPILGNTAAPLRLTLC